MVAPRTTPADPAAAAHVDPYRVAAPRPVWDGEDTEWRPRRIILDPPQVPSPECLVVTYTKDPLLLGKRFLLDQPFLSIGRGADNTLVLDADSVSRRHARVEKRDQSFFLLDLGSMNGIYRNDEPISGEVVLQDGDRFKVGPTLFRFLAGDDVEAQYLEEIYQMTITDGLTQISNKRYFYASLDIALIRCRRDDHELSILFFDLHDFKQVIDAHGTMAGEFVLREVARLVKPLCRPDDVFARYSHEEFAFVLARTTLADADALAETLQKQVCEHIFTYEAKSITITVRTGTAALQESDKAASDIVKRAAEQLSLARAQR